MKKAKEHIKKGKECFNNKEYKKAEEYFRKALLTNKNFADVMNLLGVIHHIEGKFTSAIDLFKKALKINPKYTEAILNLSVLLNDLGQYKDAKKLYTQLRKKQKVCQTQIEPVLRGKLSNLHADTGDIYRSIGLYPYAIKEYEKALTLNPDYFDIRTRLGQALRENGQLAMSEKELKKVLKADANYNQARVQLGVTFYSSGNIAEAKKEWKHVLKKNHNDEFANMYLHLCEAQTKTTPKKLKKKTIKKRTKK